MAVNHEIDQTNQLIITTWTGEASDNEFIDALTRYQHDIKGSSDYQSFNELLDFSQISEMNLTTKGLITLGIIARKTDNEHVKSRLAIVVNSTLSFGLAQMYITYRNLDPSSHKELNVFKNKADALSWLMTPVN